MIRELVVGREEANSSSSRFDTERGVGISLGGARGDCRFVTVLERWGAESVERETGKRRTVADVGSTPWV